MELILIALVFLFLSAAQAALIARFGLHVCLNLYPCARIGQQFSIQPCASLCPMRV